jgi:hypothetical protein
MAGFSLSAWLGDVFGGDKQDKAKPDPAPSRPSLADTWRAPAAEQSRVMMPYQSGGGGSRQEPVRPSADRSPVETVPGGLGEYFKNNNWYTPQYKEAETKHVEKKKVDAARADRADELSNRHVLVSKMNWDDYNALNTAQRAAVDANTAIADAVAQDEAAGGDGKKDKSYQADVEKLFGKDGGSDTYAPRTAALLSELGLGDKKLGDLDNYLNLGGLAGKPELDVLADPTTAKKDDVNAQHAITFSAQAQSTLAQTLSVGQSLIDSLRQTERGAQLFGKPDGPAIGFDHTGSDPLTADLEDLFNKASIRDNVSDEAFTNVLGEAKQKYGLDSQAIFDYFEKRLKAAEYGSENGPATRTSQDPDAYTVDEFRKRYYTGGN